jgi:putative methionine-R-sulfoxide reductase with GAF domain
MDLYSILGQPVSINDVHSPAAATPLAAFLTESWTAPPSNHHAVTQPKHSENKLGAILSSAVERVRYITGANGVALALCENEEDEMVCRASSGPAAPEVGARMYIQSGITAESMRTRQTLRCDRASTDPRVNQESCKALGIESVMVMPLIVGRSVVGMLELFGEKPLAFEERDAKTLHATAPQVQSGLREAVNAGMMLGRIPWAEEPTSPAPVEVIPFAALPVDATPGEVSDHASTGEDTRASCETAASASVTVKIPVAFPIDSFKKAKALQVQEFDVLEIEANEVESEKEIIEEEPAIPAFLARLADEASPATSRIWSQWFRPQW